MPLGLRIMLIVVSVISCVFVIKKIRKAQIRIEDTLFWIVVAIGTLVLGVLPNIAFKIAGLIGIQSPVNFVYLLFIFLVLFKSFILSVQVSQLQEKVKNLAQNIAIRDNMREQKEEE